MIKALVFGGTSEGRKLCEVSARYGVPIIYSVATEAGARAAEALPLVEVRIGRLGADQMTELLFENVPAQVYDATHPYAEEASRNIALACRRANIPLVRIVRESVNERACIYFDNMDDLIDWLEGEPGSIFVTTGSSSAEAFAGLPQYQHRVWLRVLPCMNSLSHCLALGYGPDKLICMQGPFSEELNRALFKAAGARILVTKDSGRRGGFPEKIRAAKSLGMLTAVLTKPDDPGGISLETACKHIARLGL